MRKLLAIFLAMLIPVMLLAGCRSSGQGQTHSFTFDFSESDHGWVGGFTDYPVNFEPGIYELEFSHAGLPKELGSGKGLLLQGHNRSDDLFMYIRKQLTGLKPDTLYSVVLEVEFATDAPAGAFGIGGPPGEAVFVKVGAATEEPVPVVGDSGGEPYFQLSVDKGSQSEGGQNAVVVGNTAKIENEEFGVYELKILDNNEAPLVVKSDAKGALWVFVGSDSGFEGKTILYYTNIKVNLTEA